MISSKLTANPNHPTEEIDMANTVKKATPAPKPTKTVAKKEKVAKAAKPTMPSREQIEQLARSYWAARGYQDGSAEQDWLRAEQELLKKAS
jgi:hypothetical protein